MVVGPLKPVAAVWLWLAVLFGGLGCATEGGKSMEAAMWTEPEVATERAARAAAAVERHDACFEALAGAAVGVVWDGELVYVRTGGMAERAVEGCEGGAGGVGGVEASRAVTPTTNFRLASVTKQFTAMAVLLLVDEGTVGLDETLDAFFVDLPDWCRPPAAGVTVRQLLTHTSGLPDYEDLIPPVAPGSKPLQLQNRQVLHLVMDAPPSHRPPSHRPPSHGPISAPGGRYHYSNTGYALLSEIVEIRSGMSFGRFVRERLFEPLGMHGSRVQERGITAIPNRAFGYTRQADGTLLRTDQSPTSAVIGDGAIYSSIADLARWEAALRVGLAEPVAGLPSPELLREAMTPQSHDPGRDVGYGYGWRISPPDPALAGWTNIWHTGETIGFRAIISRWEADWRLAAGDLSRRGAAGLQPQASSLQPALTILILVNQENDVPPLKEVGDRMAADLLAGSVR